MRRHPPARRLAPMLLAGFAMIVAACGDDGTTGVDGATTSSTTTTTTAAPDAGGDAPDPTETTTPTEPVPLEATFRGVTAESIKVGVPVVDLDAVRAFVDLDHGSYEAAYQALIDEVNGNGGINGRQVELIFDRFLPIGAEDMERICVRFTQDEEVFLTMGSLLDDGPLCYTALNDTAHIGSTQNASRLEASTAPWFTATRDADEALDAIVRGFHAEGIFDGAKVAVVGVIADKGIVEDVALPALEELDVEVVEVSFLEATVLDEAAADQEVALVVERQESDGADVVLAVAGGTSQYLGGLEDSTFRPRIASTAIGATRVYIRDRSGRDLSILDNAVAAGTAEQLAWWDDPAVQDCIALVEATGEPTILDPNTRGLDEPENLVSVAAACRNVALFTAIATAAGPVLTNDTFRDAGNSLGDFHIPGYGAGFYGPDSPDGEAPIFLYEWQPDIEDVRATGATF